MPIARLATLFTVFAVLGLPAVAVPAPAGPGDVTSTFDTDDEGWTVSGDAQGNSVVPDWNAEGGNPGGYVSAEDNVTGGIWYWTAPDAYLGDRSGAFGRALRFDLRQSDTSTQLDEDDVILRGAGLEIVFDTDVNPGIDWTSYTVPLTTDAGWIVTSTAAAPTEAEFMSVLGDLEGLFIRGEYRFGADTGGLDNVVFEGAATTAAELGAIPGVAALAAAFPNPFATEAQLDLTLARSERVTVQVFDLLGREVARLHDGALPAGGPHPFTLRAADFSSGLYVVRAAGADWAVTRRVVVRR